MAGDEHELHAYDFQGQLIARMNVSQLRAYSDSHPLVSLKYEAYWNTQEVVKQLKCWLKESEQDPPYVDESEDEQFDRYETKLILKWMEKQIAIHDDKVKFVFKTTYDC